jgi:hypothetical protein
MTSFAARCARATIGKPKATPPRIATNSRRLIETTPSATEQSRLRYQFSTNAAPGHCCFATRASGRGLLWVSRDARPMFSLGLLYPLPADGIVAPPRNVAMCQKRAFGRHFAPITECKSATLFRCSRDRALQGEGQGSNHFAARHSPTTMTGIRLRP